MGRKRASSKVPPADWRRVRELYRQVSEIVDDREGANVPPIELLGALAEQTGRVFAHYDGFEPEFIDDLFDTWVEVGPHSRSRRKSFRALYLDDRFDRFPPYQQHSTTRRRPKPFEASVETVRRLRQANAAREAVRELPVAGILGGSASYGRFFNTSGGLVGTPSDLDLLLVLDEYSSLDSVLEALGTAQGVEAASIGKARVRARVFQRQRRKSERLIFSHKVELWETQKDPLLEPFEIPSSYVMSLHFFSLEDFEFMLLRDKGILEAESDARFSRFVTDFRDTPPQRDDNQRSFSGHDVTLPLESRRSKDGFLVRVRVCHIEDGRYYPGLHQNIVLPQYEIRWEHPDVRLYLALLGFRWKLVERLMEERRSRPFEHQNLSQSHARSEVFAPHITRRASRE